MNEEVWKPWPADPRYEVSNFGNVRSWVTRGGATKLSRVDLKPHTLTPRKDDVGRFIVGASGKNRYVHRMVLEAFVGAPKDGEECCHNNGNASDNSLHNLRWDTRIENIHDRDRHGTTARGHRGGNSKLTDSDVIQILQSNESGPVLSRRFCVDRQTIHCIRKGKTWKHIRRAL